MGCTFGEVGRTNTQNTINTIKARGPAGNADALLGDSKAGAESDGVGVLSS